MYFLRGLLGYALLFAYTFNCRMEVDAGIDWNVECSNCSVLSPMQTRLKLPVTLSDKHLTIKTTLKSPDAEKICPFTALHIKEKADQGLTVVDDLSLAIDNTDVICFLKYYIRAKSNDKTKRYVILKMYTAEEVQSFHATVDKVPDNNDDCVSPAAKDTASSSLLSSPISGQPSPAGKQLFSPTMKDALEDTAEETSDTQQIISIHSPAKRSISFGTVSKTDLEKIDPLETDEDLPHILGTPKKKTRAGTTDQ